VGKKISACQFLLGRTPGIGGPSLWGGFKKFPPKKTRGVYTKKPVGRKILNGIKEFPFELAFLEEFPGG